MENAVKANFNSRLTFFYFSGLNTRKRYFYMLYDPFLHIYRGSALARLRGRIQAAFISLLKSETKKGAG